MSDLQHAYSEHNAEDMHTAVMLVREMLGYRALLDLITADYTINSAYQLESVDVAQMVSVTGYAADLKKLLNDGLSLLAD